MEEITPRLRQVMSAQGGLRDSALVLLSRVEPRSLSELVAMLGCTRAELMGVMGELKGRELVTFSRPDEANGIHWYATAKGRELGSSLFDRLDKTLPAPTVDAGPDVAETRPVMSDLATPRKSVAGRRRVVLGEREQPSERSFSFD